MELQGSTAKKGTVSSATSPILCCKLFIPKERTHAGQNSYPLYHSLLGERKVTGGQWERWNMNETDGLLTCSQSVVSCQGVHLLLALKLLLF